MLKAVAARCFQTGYAIFPGTAFAVAPLMAAARGARLPPGWSTVALSELPCQGRVTHGLIRAGAALNGSVFGHRERILSSRKRGCHLKYTVKTPLSEDRGAQCIVCGGPGTLCMNQREGWQCGSGWDARRVLQPIAVAIGKKRNAADRPSPHFQHRGDSCRGSLEPRVPDGCQYTRDHYASFYYINE